MLGANVCPEKYDSFVAKVSDQAEDGSGKHLIFHVLGNVLERDCHVWRALVAVLRVHMLVEMVKKWHVREWSMNKPGELPLSEAPVLLGWIEGTHHFSKLLKRFLQSVCHKLLASVST